MLKALVFVLFFFSFHLNAAPTLNILICDPTDKAEIGQLSISYLEKLFSPNVTLISEENLSSHTLQKWQKMKNRWEYEEKNNDLKMIVVLVKNIEEKRVELGGFDYVIGISNVHETEELLPPSILAQCNWHLLDNDRLESTLFHLLSSIRLQAIQKMFFSPVYPKELA